jgi:hypothetical protein
VFFGAARSGHSCNLEMDQFKDLGGQDVLIHLRKTKLRLDVAAEDVAEMPRTNSFSSSTEVGQVFHMLGRAVSVSVEASELRYCLWIAGCVTGFSAQNRESNRQSA